MLGLTFSGAPGSNLRSKPNASISVSALGLIRRLSSRLRRYNGYRRQDGLQDPVPCPEGRRCESSPSRLRCCRARRRSFSCRGLERRRRPASAAKPVELRRHADLAGGNPGHGACDAFVKTQCLSLKPGMRGAEIAAPGPPRYETTTPFRAGEWPHSSLRLTAFSRNGEVHRTVCGQLQFH